MTEPMTGAAVLDAITRARALPRPTNRLDNGLCPPNDAVCVYLLSALVAIEVHTCLRQHRVDPTVTTTEIIAEFRGLDGRWAAVSADNDNDEGQGETPDVIACWSARGIKPHVETVTLAQSFDGKVWRTMAAFLRGEGEPAAAGGGSGE